MTYNEFYIGYHLTANLTLKTLNGHSQSWAPWEKGQPQLGEHCVSVYNSGGEFWSETCDRKYFGICQWPGYSCAYYAYKILCNK